MGLGGSITDFYDEDIGESLNAFVVFGKQFSDVFDVMDFFKSDAEKGFVDIDKFLYTLKLLRVVKGRAELLSAVSGLDDVFIGLFDNVFGGLKNYIFDGVDIDFEVLEGLSDFDSFDLDMDLLDEGLDNLDVSKYQDMYSEFIGKLSKELGVDIDKTIEIDRMIEDSDSLMDFIFLLADVLPFDAEKEFEFKDIKNIKDLFIFIKSFKYSVVKEFVKFISDNGISSKSVLEHSKIDVFGKENFDAVKDLFVISDNGVATYSRLLSISEEQVIDENGNYIGFPLNIRLRITIVIQANAVYKNAIIDNSEKIQKSSIVANECKVIDSILYNGGSVDNKTDVYLEAPPKSELVSVARINKSVVNHIDYINVNVSQVGHGANRVWIEGLNVAEKYTALIVRLYKLSGFEGKEKFFKFDIKALFNDSFELGSVNKFPAYEDRNWAGVDGNGNDIYSYQTIAASSNFSISLGNKSTQYKLFFNSSDVLRFVYRDVNYKVLKRDFDEFLESDVYDYVVENMNLSIITNVYLNMQEGTKHFSEDNKYVKDFDVDLFLFFNRDKLEDFYAGSRDVIENKVENFVYDVAEDADVFIDDVEKTYNEILDFWIGD